MIIRYAEEKNFIELRQFYDGMCKVLSGKDFLPEGKKVELRRIKTIVIFLIQHFLLSVLFRLVLFGIYNSLIKEKEAISYEHR